MSKIGKLITQWDESEIIEQEIKYQLEEKCNELESGETTKEEIENDVYNDYELLTIEYEAFIEDLDSILKKKNIDGFWKANVKGFGWRGLNSAKALRADDANELLNKILPKTNCKFKIYNYGRGIAIQNFHHDSPTGNEWYYITPIKESSYEKAC